MSSSEKNSIFCVRSFLVAEVISKNKCQSISENHEIILSPLEKREKGKASETRNMGCVQEKLRGRTT